MLGIGWITLVCCIPLIFIFRNRRLGFLDPINMFMITRVSPMLASMIMFLTQIPITNFTLLFVISSSLFLVSLYFATPKTRIIKIPSNSFSIKFFFRLAIFLVVIKTLILASAIGGIPLVSDGGSNAYIDFDVNNKLGSSFLLGLGVADLVILAFVIPLFKRRDIRLLSLVILLYAVLLGLSGGKKSSLLGIAMAIALGEYLRVLFVEHQRVYFLKRKFMLVGFMAVLLWATWLYSKTESVDWSMIDLRSISTVFDFVFFQWAYPFMLFVSGELNQFFTTYEVNRAAYFFHSILSPIGFPAFKYSIGPAINEFLQGSMTGNGINPTFIIEGYVLVGVFLPLYAVFTGVVIGKVRAFLMNIAPFEFKVALIALVLPALYTFAVDGLLALKILYIVVFVFTCIVFPLRLLTVRRVRING